jgi:hypothetical protein
VPTALSCERRATLETERKSLINHVPALCRGRRILPGMAVCAVRPAGSAGCFRKH